MDPAQYKALQGHKQKLGREGLYFGYDSLEQLRVLLQGHLAGTMARLHPRPLFSFGFVPALGQQVF
jgi:hypothetical protein